MVMLVAVGFLVSSNKKGIDWMLILNGIILQLILGLANFASIGIQIGGIGAIAPGQRKTLTELGVKAMIGSTLACFMTALIAGMVV